MNVPLRLLALAALAIVLSACSRLTVENYDRLRVGMRYTQVRELLGPPSRCSDLLTVRSCTWGDDARYVQVSFVADQVVVFHAENLR
jgi:hypothetical protein